MPVKAAQLSERLGQPFVVEMIGFLRSTSLSDAPHYVTAFRQGLREAGFIEGQTVTIEYRWAEGRLDRLPNVAADLVRQQVALIVGIPLPHLRLKLQPRPYQSCS